MFRGFHEDTEVITNRGTIPFKQLKSGERIQVIDKDGIWRDATVIFYGIDQLYEFTFQKGNKINIIKCTKDQRWILNNDVITKHLGPGNAIYPFAYNTDYHMSYTGKLEYGNEFWTLKSVREINERSKICGIQQSSTHSFCLKDNIVTHDC